MPTADRTLFWTLATGAAVVAYYALLAASGLWRYVGAPPMEPLFADFYSTLSAADCAALGYNVYQENPCDAAKQPHQYGPGWLWLRFLGIGVEQRVMVGLALNLAMLGVALRFFAPRTAREAGFALLVLISPAAALLVNRANTDGVLFLLVVAAATLFAARRPVSNLAAAGLVFFATSLKFFPAVAMAGVVRGARSFREFLLHFVGFTAATLLFAWVMQDEFADIAKYSPTFLPGYAFGADLLFKAMGLPHPALWGLAASLLAVAVALWLALRLRLPATDDRTESQFATGLAVGLFLFLLTANFDYKLMFFLGAVPLWRTALRQGSGPAWQTRLLWLAAWLFLYKLWSSFFRGAAIFVPDNLLGLVGPGYAPTVNTLFFVLDNGSFWVPVTVLLALWLRLILGEFARLTGWGLLGGFRG